MEDHAAGPEHAPTGGERALAVLRRTWAPLLVVVGIVVALALRDAVSEETGNAGSADVLGVVEDDPSWLGYLPRQGAVPGLSVVGLTEMTQDGPVSRRVDVVVPGVTQGVVSLCFVGFVDDLVSVCPDAVALGEVAREVGLPVIGLDGPIGALDWMAVYAAPPPELAELDYLRR